MAQESVRANVNEIDVIDILARYKTQPRPREIGGKPYRSMVRYHDVVCAFDIETSYIKDIEQSIMYIWQFQIGKDCTIFGRTWTELLLLVDKITDYLYYNERLVVYVHNLSYEFQFLSGIWKFAPDDVFAIKSRRVLKCVMDKLEFRCSYLHSNMSLAKFMQSVGVPLQYQKLTYDYNKLRLPSTKMTSKELDYCANDVIGLVHAIYIEMERDGDTLYTIPLTSTGYVRRDCRAAMETWMLTHSLPLPDYDTYTRLRQAFRGGNTHANRYITGAILHDVYSVDRASSYPETQCNLLYPISSFVRYGNATIDDVRRLLKHNKALLMVISMENVTLRDETWGCPYLSISKCRDLEDAIPDNGRVLSAAYLETTITDIDFKIIDREYKCTKMTIISLEVATYGKLPEPLVKTIQSYFMTKTALKGNPGQSYYYAKSKNKLNACYGMTAQDPVHDEYDFDGISFTTRDTDKQAALEKYNKSAFLSYAWGVWCTAWARWELEEMMWIVQDTPGARFVYSDTDSVKYTGQIDITGYNQHKMELSTASGSYAVDAKGVAHYMGVYEDDGYYRTFRTWGAKKYAYTERARKKHIKSAVVHDTGCYYTRHCLTCHPVHITVAGVPKYRGALELQRAGGLEAFEPGFTFHAGKLESVYNDCPPVKSWTVPDGETVEITRNVVLRPTTYVLGLSEDYEKILTDIDGCLTALKILDLR